MPEEPQEEEVTAFSDEKDLLEAARLHVSQMPTPAVKNDWQAPIRAYWRDYLQEAVVYSDQRHHLFEAVELGILPRGLVEQATQDDPACQETYEGFRQQAGHLSAALERGAATPPEEPVPAYTDLERLYTFVGAAFQGRVPTARLEEWLDRDEWVDLGIAQSEDVPPWMLAELSCSRHTSVRRMARRHPALTAEMHAVSRDHRLNEILETSQQLPLRRDNQAQWRALSAAGKLLRFAALCTAPPAIGRPRWHLFSQSVVWQERLAAAIAVSTHPRFGVLLRLLANDGNFLVRAAAQARLRSETFTWEDIPASPP